MISRYLDPCANDVPIVRAARSTDHKDPSIALREHHVGPKIPRFAKVNVNKVGFFFTKSY